MMSKSETFGIIALALLAVTCAFAAGTQVVERTDPTVVHDELICDDTAHGAQDAESAHWRCPEDATTLIYAVPFSVCDDSSDCDRAIKAACGARGSTVRKMQFDKGKGHCSGECDDGTTVQTVCPRP